MTGLTEAQKKEIELREKKRRDDEEAAKRAAYVVIILSNYSFVFEVLTFNLCSEKLERKRHEAEKRLAAIAEEKAKEKAKEEAEHVVVDEKKAAAADLLRAIVNQKK